MDEKWFRERKRKVGITNAEIASRMGRDHTVISKIISGSQRLTIEWAEVFAEALKVPLSEVLERLGGVDEGAFVGFQETETTFATSFAEGDAVPFVHKGADDRQVPTIGEALGARPGVDIWRVSGRSMVMGGLLPGDYILVDTHAAERARPGDVVIAQVYGAKGAKTVLRRFVPPALIAAAAPMEDEPVHIVDGHNVVIRGKVVASWRV